MLLFFVQTLRKIVAGNLKVNVPQEVIEESYRDVEALILYDADTIEPNVVLSAFYRNIQINAGYALQRGESIDLRAYVQGLPRWIGMKDSFRAHMLTERGKQLCDERQQRNRALAAELA